MTDHSVAVQSTFAASMSSTKRFKDTMADVPAHIRKQITAQHQKEEAQRARQREEDAMVHAEAVVLGPTRACGSLTLWRALQPDPAPAFIRSSMATEEGAHPSRQVRV